MSVTKLCLGLVSLLAVTGCAVSTPFRGPGYDSQAGVTGTSGETVVVAVTKSVLPEDRAMRSLFWDHVEKVEGSLAARPGFIGHSKRTVILGDRAWTITVWKDEASLDDFVGSEVHQAAIGEVAGALRAARFVRFEATRQEIPVAWDRALAALEASGRGYD